MCARRGIANPKLHISAVERIVQAPGGYAPGNIPPRCEIVAMEEDPSVQLPELARAIHETHRETGGASLLIRTLGWVRLG